LLPPLAEQERIVAAIEEQFSWLDAGLMGLAQVRRNLKRMRASLLAAAVTGRLGVRGIDLPSHDGLPTDWSWKPLEEIITRLRNGVFVSRPGREPTGRPILRISAVRPLGLDVSDVRYVPESASLDDTRSFVLEEDDLLFTRYSGNPEYVGACARVPAGTSGLVYPDKLIRVQVDRAIVEPRFVEIAANAGLTRHTIRSRVKTTAGQTGISGRDLKSVPFPIPPLKTQQQIVEAVDYELVQVGRLEEQMTMGVGRASALRASILKSAFSGRLVPQNPDDEPSSALLEQIAAKRASSHEHKATNARRRRRVTT
jgi:type I restriction enzyme S subunit